MFCSGAWCRSDCLLQVQVLDRFWNSTQVVGYGLRGLEGWRLRQHKMSRRGWCGRSRVQEMVLAVKEPLGCVWLPFMLVRVCQLVSGGDHARFSGERGSWRRSNLLFVGRALCVYVVMQVDGWAWLKVCLF
ncbi:Protein of unknown function [Gryllus bimaculatus]|nr:Protein of unknown function [Gryllus bimaculatus]